MRWAVADSEARLRSISVVARDSGTFPAKIFTTTPVGDVDYFNRIWPTPRSDSNIRFIDAAGSMRMLQVTA
jgi:hypothetical protein